MKKHNHLSGAAAIPFVLVGFFLFGIDVSQANLANAGKRGLYVSSIDEVLQLRDSEVDLATAALILSEQWSDGVHGLRYRRELDAMAEEIKTRLQERKLRANFKAIPVINEYLFNELGYTAVSDAEDPNDLFLHSVMDRRQGYCLSLSTLYLALGERLGLPLYGVVVPGHFFVRYDSRSIRFNIECTARGAQQNDSHYIEKFNVPEHHDRLYMENLTKKQTLGCLFNNFGVVYLETGQPKYALLALDLAARINPKLAEARSNLSIALQEQGQEDDALEQLLRALENNPNDPAVHRELGRAYFKRKNYAQALRSIVHSRELDPENADTFVLQGEVYAAQKHYRKARESYDEALRLDPEHAYAQIRLGHLFYALENYQGAVRAYQQALRLDKGPLRVEAHYWMASAYTELGWTDYAVKSYQQVLDLQPASFVAAYNLGQLYAKQKSYAEAIDYFKQAIEINPQKAGVHYNLAVCYAETDRPDRAHQSFADALDVDPQMGLAHYGIAISYYNRQAFQMAWEHLDRARDLGFDVPADTLKQMAARVGVTP
jgi:tetratricopeptide (TPR) repeat protein